jgi:hypothetical protein
MNPGSNLTDKPWYQQFWPWFLISLPAAAVIAGISTVFIAMSGKDSIVVDDYYKKGLAINRVIEEQEMAASMGLSANAKYTSDTGELALTVKSDSAFKEKTLGLKLVHPTLADLDRHVLLHRDAQGVFKASLKGLHTGRWRVILEPGDKRWRLDGHVVVPGSEWHFRPNV